jgi:hypothetical protein
MDSLLAYDSGRIPGCDFSAYEVSEGAAVVLDCAVWVAFLGSVCGARLASALVCGRFLPKLDEEALI